MNPADDSLPLLKTVVPDDPGAVAETVREAFRGATPVYTIGGGTSLTCGAPPTTPGLGLSLSRMAKVIDFPARDLTITAQAGVTIQALSESLATEQLRLPVDIPQAGRATLGGAVACNPSGPRRYGCGTIRDYVIGLSAVDGRGTPFSGGGRVVKNAAGYDLCRLMTGSLGALGVITQVTLMVKPIPEANALVACDLPSPAAAERLLDAMVHTKVLPVAVELLAGPAWRDCPSLPASENETVPLAPRPSPPAPRLVVGLEGTAVEVDWMVDQLCREWKAAGVAAPAAISGEQAQQLWSRLTEFPSDGGPDGRPAPLVVRISVLPSAVTSLVGQLLTIDPECSVQAHAGAGVLRARFGWEPAAMAAGLEDRLRPAVAAAGGHVTVLASPAEAKLSHRAVWGPPGDGAAVMRSLKQQFDPKGILNPGRFVFDD